MGLFDSVAGTFFNAATSVYRNVVTPVQSVASNVVSRVTQPTQPIVQGSFSTGATEQVAVQPRPPIVTAVTNRPVTTTQQGTTQTPVSTPSGGTVYVSSRASPKMPKPVDVSRPVEIQAHSVIDITRMLTPGVGLAAAAQIISGDPKVIQNAALDVAGLRSMAIQNRASALQARDTELQNQATILQQQNQIRQASLEQQVLGFEQRKQDIVQRKQRFESLGPATSIEEYNTRLGEYNLLNQDIAGLNTESARINEAGIAARREGLLGQIGLLNERDRLQAEGVNLNVDAANVGTTGLGALEGFWGSVDAVVSEKITKPLMPAQSEVEPVIKIIGFANPITAPSAAMDTLASFVGYKPTSVATIQAQYIGELYGGIREKPFTEATFFAVGAAFGGVGRLGGNIAEPLVAASKVPGAGIGAKSLGAIAKHGNAALGLMYGGYSGFRAATSPDPIGTLVQIGAQEVTPMLGGAMVGASAPEIVAGARRTVGSGVAGLESRVKSGEVGKVIREMREIPLTSTESFEVGLSPQGRGKTLLSQKQLAKARSIASTGEERVIAFDITAGKEIKLTRVKSSSNRVQWEYPKGLDPTHEVISLHSHPKEITFSRGDMRKFGFDPKVNEVAKGVVTPSGKVHIIEKPLKGGYKSDVFVQKWMEDYKPNWLRDLFQPKSRRIKTFARTAAEMEMPFRIIEPGQNVVYKATRIGKPSVSSAKLSQARSAAPEMEPRLFDIEEMVKFDWVTGRFEPFTSIAVKGKPRIIKPGGTAQLSETQLLGIQERVYRGKPTAYTARQRGRFPGTSEFIDEKGFWSYEQFPSERFLDIQAKTIRRGQPKGIGGVTQAPKPVLEEMGLGKGWKVTEKAATDALAKWNQPELGPPYSTMSSKFNKPFKAIGRKMKVDVSQETSTRIKKSQNIAQVYQQGYRPVRDISTGLEFEPLGTGSQGAILPTGKKFSQPAPSPGGSKTLAKTFKNAENSLNPLTSEKIVPSGQQDVTLISRPLDLSNIGDYSRSYGSTLTKYNEAIAFGKSKASKQLYESGTHHGLYGGFSRERSELPNALGMVRGRKLSYREEETSTGPLALRTFGIPQLSGEREDTSVSLGVFPMIASVGVNIADRNVGSIRIPSVDKISGVDTNLRNVQPAITPLIGIGQLPSSLVGTVLEPGLDITPLVSSRIDNLQLPAITQVPTQAIIQIPDLTQTQVNLQQQLLITNMEVPPYTPPEFTFEIPRIPQIIIPGFPMGLGGGGGGGGGAGGLGGYLFEETLKGGGDSDPFGIGGMNFDAGAIAGIPSGSRTKRRRRKK